MSQDTENFEQLRRLLAVKRHEQPPPRYFNDFSHHVIQRIKAGQRRTEGSFLDRLFDEAPWLQRVWGAFESQPILAGVCGVAVCGLLIGGVLFSDRAEVSPIVLVPGMETASTDQAQVTMAENPLFAKPVAVEPSSTSPISTARTDEMLLGDFAKLKAQPASFNFPGGN